MSSQLNGKHIVIIGAGVIGLQTAITLLEAGATVTIIAKHVPEDKAIGYTSPWAGAQWRTHATAEDKEIQQWDIESYNVWFDWVEKEKTQAAFATKSGLEKFHSIFYWTAPDAEIASGPRSAWWAPYMRQFRELAPSALPAGVHAGATYDAITIDTGVYLPFLLSRARALGATLIEAALPTSGGLAGALATATQLLPAYGVGAGVDAFVNASGIRARELVPDSAVHPVRGQTVLVRGTPRALTTCWRPDGLSYVIPRAASATTVLGGTKEVDDWRAEPDPRTTRDILERCKVLAPELLDEKGEFDVLSVNVGFRPGRTGGPRVEVEEVRVGGGRSMPVCHEYGHAGAGYQNSFGSAKKVLRLLEEHFEKRRGGAKL
ncbi:putative d-amino-acid oxidase protein [Neofusicoccum parvum]|nr:putative d-amino-acid oxidase protein [Neofusicoccum parvum]